MSNIIFIFILIFTFRHNAEPYLFDLFSPWSNLAFRKCVLTQTVSKNLPFGGVPKSIKKPFQPFLVKKNKKKCNFVFSYFTCFQSRNTKSNNGLFVCHRTRINILGADPRMNPFNNDFYNGRCTGVTNPQTRTRQRIPWNVGTLNYEVRLTPVDATLDSPKRCRDDVLLSVFPDCGGGNRVERNL